MVVAGVVDQGMLPLEEQPLFMITCVKTKRK